MTAEAGAQPAGGHEARVSAPIVREAMTKLGRFRGRVAAGALALVAIWEIGVLVTVRDSAPAPADWRAAAAAVRAAADQDALVVFAPRWIDPVGRRWLGDRISLDQAARMDAARYREVWEVSIRGAIAPEVAGAAPASAQTFGRVRVRRFIRAAPTITWDLRAQSRIHEIDFEPRKAVLLELRQPYEQRRLDFRQVNLGAELVVYAGLASVSARSENRATALLQVMVDGQEVIRASVANGSGWLALPMARTQPGLHDVEFLARVQDSHGPIHLALCVAAEGRTPSP